MDFGTTIANPALAGSLICVIGLIAGICGGYWGVGAGWMVVPALLLFGVSKEAAVAATIVHMAAKSLIPIYLRLKEKRATGDVPMLTVALPLIVFSLPLAWLGAPVLSWAKEQGYSEVGVPVCYAVILLVIGVQCLRGHKEKEAAEGGSCSLNRGRTIAFSGIAGAAMGFINGALGVGGGLLGRPILQHLMGLSEFATASISQLALLAGSAAAIVSHWTEQNMLWPLAIALSISGTVGQVAGTALSQHALARGRGEWANLTFAVAVFGVLIATLLKLGAVWVEPLDILGLIWICIVGLGICALVIWGALKKGDGGADLACENCPLLDI